MSEKLKESLSAVIDGEADEFELRRVLDEMNRDELLASSWERYHLIGATMRGESGKGGMTSLSVAMRERVWAELQAQGDEATTADPDEAAIVTGEPSAVTAANRRWTPVAVAATVALAVVVGFLGFSSLEQSTPTTTVAATSVEAEPPLNAQQQSLYDAVALSTEVTDSDQDRTDAYIVRHYQQIGMDRPGLGFARMVAYERD